MGRPWFVTLAAVAALAALWLLVDPDTDAELPPEVVMEGDMPDRPALPDVAGSLPPAEAVDQPATVTLPADSKAKKPNKNRVIHGRVVDGDGKPVARSRVELFELIGQPTAGIDITDEDGSFRFERLKRVDYTLRVHDPQAWSGFAAVERSARPSKQEVTVVLDHGVRATAWVTGRVVDWNGNPMHGAVVFLTAGRHGWSGGRIADTDHGTFRLGPVQPGTYVLELMVNDEPQETVPELTVAPHQILDVGDIVIRPSGTVDVRMTCGPGVDCRRVNLGVVGHSAVWEAARMQQGVNVRSFSLKPGGYELVVAGGGAGEVVFPFTIAADEVTMLDVDVVAGVEHELVFNMPVGPDPVQPTTVSVVDAGGRVASRREIDRNIYQLDKEAYHLSIRLAPGSYVVSAEQEGRTVLAEPLEVFAGETGPVLRLYWLP